MTSTFRTFVWARHLSVTAFAILLLSTPECPGNDGERTRLGPLHSWRQWELSAKKGADAPASPQIVSPGLGGSQRAVLFTMTGYNHPTNTSAQHVFGPLQGERLKVELLVLPSSEFRGLTVAVRGGREAAAYIRFNGRKTGVCQHYDDKNTYRDIAPFPVDAVCRVRIELNTKTQRLKAWINEQGGQDYPFHARADSIDRLDLFMTHGNGPDVTALVDEIAVRDDNDRVAFSDDFEEDIARQPGDAGAVRVGESGHWLEFRGRPVLLVGDSITQGWMELGENFDQRAYIDALAERGINALLLWSVIGVIDQTADERIGYDAPEIWPWVREQGRFDLTGFNEEYFNRLRDLVELANARDIVVIITVHDGWPKTRFAGHPFNVVHGGPLTDRSQYVDLHDYGREMPAEFNPAWDRRQKHQFFTERFTARLIDATADLPNVIYEIFNEGEWYDQSDLRAFQVHFLNFMKARTDRLLIVNDDHVAGENFHGVSDADVLSDHKPKWDQLSEESVLVTFHRRYAAHFRETPSKPYLFTEPVPAFNGDPLHHDRLMRLLWGSALGGSGVLVQNDASFGFDPRSGMTSNTVGREMVMNLEGHVSRFFRDQVTALDQMQPNGGLASTGVCLAQPGVQYVVYAQRGDEFTLDLTAAKDRSLLVRWYIPATAEAHSGASIIGGQRAERFTPPFKTDAVLHLRSSHHD